MRLLGRPWRHGGFTYLGVLLAIAVMSIGLLAAAEVWVTSARREKMVEVAWIGEQFVQAIGSYYEASPGGRKVFPPSLIDLLEDRRGLVPRRHLRKVYLNPFSGAADWQLVQGPSGGVRGIKVPEIEGLAANADREFVYRPVESPALPRQGARP